MDFSEEWKSTWTISSVFDPPLLISRPTSQSLGPLLFTPSPKTLNLLLSSPLLSSRFSLPPYPRCRLEKTLSTQSKYSTNANITSQSQLHEQIPTINNNLQMLRCSKNEFLLFFPFGDDLDRVGFVKIALKGSQTEILNLNDGNILQSDHEFESRIRGISVSSVFDASLEVSTESGNSVIVGFLLACTLGCVHWYRVEIGNIGFDFGEPILAYLGSKSFGQIVIHACWNPQLPEESLVLLENGDLFLFNLESCTRADDFPVKLKGTKISVSLEGVNLDSGECNARDSIWLSCGFSWHPRIFVVACSSAVFLVDRRPEESNVSVLVKIDTLHLNRTIKNSQFIAFSMVDADAFYFAVATEDNLFLLDIRKPMMPVLQWAHGLDSPHYVSVFRLSEIRSTMKEDNYKWATDSGFAILLGSFLNCKFSLFCYGPPLPTPDESVASKTIQFCNSLGAWELPTEVSLLGCQCNCGDCLLAHDFSKALLHEWKKARVLGFCVIGHDLLDPQPEADGSSGFTVIRLVSSGMLESQKYCASYDYASCKLKESMAKSSQVENSFLDLFIDQTYTFPRRFRYVHLDSLLGFMNHNLPKVLMSKMRRICPVRNTPYTQDNYDRVCDILKAAGVESIGFCPSIRNVLNGISWPMSLHEITSSRMWGGLNVDILQLAFTIYPELVGTLVEYRKITLEALDIPQLPQLPPFFSKMPTSRSNKWSWNLQLSDVLVGPVLPLPYLRALPKVKDNNGLILEEEGNDEATVTMHCNDVRMVASEMALSGSHFDLSDSPAISLANDREERWVPTQELKPLLFLKPSALSENRSTEDATPRQPVYEDEKFDTFISRTRGKVNTSSPTKEPVGLELFDDMCPIELNFDFPEMKFGSEELKGYKLLKRQFSKWQNGNTQYQDLCKSLKIQKRAP